MKELTRFLSSYALLRKEIALYEKELGNTPHCLKDALRRKKEELEQRTAVIRSCMEQPEKLIERHIVKLHYIDGMVFEQIAEQLFLSERHVYRLHKSALLQIKDYLSEGKMSWYVRAKL